MAAPQPGLTPRSTRGLGEQRDTGLGTALRRGLNAGGVSGEDMFLTLETRPSGTLMEVTGRAARKPLISKDKKWISWFLRDLRNRLA